MDRAMVGVGAEQRRYNEAMSRQTERDARLVKKPTWVLPPRGLSPAVLPPGVTRMWVDYRGRLRVRVKAGSSPA